MSTMETDLQVQTAAAARGGFVPVEPFDLVVLGATGDLALRKLMPALYHRWCDGQIPQQSRIIAAARQDMTSEAYRARMRDAFETFRPDESLDEECWAAFTQLVDYAPVDLADGADGYGSLKTTLNGDPQTLRVFYLALPPQLFGPVCEALGAHELKTPRTRIVLEKPIGHDLTSAQAINGVVGSVFGEDAIFRIDHYLGKETVQNLLILRFANALFEPVWNSVGVDHVQITVAEDIGAGNRASYYDGAGALRDMVQNHLLQLLCLVAMEPPHDMSGGAVREEKLKVLRALRPLTPQTIAANAVRGQYEEGPAGPSYAGELGRNSATETFVALRAHIDNWRWAGTPFYLRTGKRMRRRRSEIIVQFKPVPHSIFGRHLTANKLVIRLQPDEGMKLMLMTKEPGPGGLRLRSVPLNLSYAETFPARYPDAYERLVMAVVRGNLELFMHRAEVEAAWAWTDQILQSWREADTQLDRYNAGEDGPASAVRLLGRDDREWHD